MTHRNETLAQLLHTLAGIYRFQGNNKFRAIAYQHAANSIEGLSDDITHYAKNNTLQEIPGIGKSLEADIREFVKSGHIKRLDVLKKKVPLGLIELLDITGFGPESLKTIYQKLKLESKEEVISALQDGTIEKLKGFGPKKVENLLRTLKLHKTIEDRMLLWDALRVGDDVVAALKNLPEVKKVELAGSLRRKKETIGDIDVLVAAETSKRKSIIDFYTSSKLASRVLMKGDTRASIILKSANRQADLRIVKENEFGSALQYFTGSKPHNIHLRSIARNKGYKISEYGIFDADTESRIAGRTEKEIYETLDMQMMPPEMREDRGEIELAKKHQLPVLVEESDIRGDLQMHSDWSDGMQTLEQIADYIQSHFNYEYVAITDHSVSSRIAGGMNESELLKQIEAIHKVNEKSGIDFLKTGVEVDILPDGSLDISDEVLSQFDWVTASIHAGFTKDNTDRLVKACENPFVHCIGHPTGRLIGKRAAYPFSFDTLIRAAKYTGTALEINAQPNRMDLSDEMVFQARLAGVKFVISTDSHRPGDFHFMPLGVAIARRAWCTRSDILNALSWNELRKFTTKKRRQMKVEA